MPFEITYQGDFLFMRVFGVLTKRDLLNGAEEAEIVEKSLPTEMNRAIDVTSVETFEIDFPTILAVAERRRRRKYRRPIKSALIARRPIEVGFARMFQTLNDHPQIEIRIVQSLQEAKDWFTEDMTGSRPEGDRSGS
ncbi:MAG: hypothetical protein ACHQQS_09550 [Thermoanaerobaculales bacterium]